MIVTDRTTKVEDHPLSIIFKESPPQTSLHTRVAILGDMLVMGSNQLKNENLGKIIHLVGECVESFADLLRENYESRSMYITPYFVAKDACASYRKKLAGGELKAFRGIEYQVTEIIRHVEDGLSLLAEQAQTGSIGTNDRRKLLTDIIGIPKNILPVLQGLTTYYELSPWAAKQVALLSSEQYAYTSSRAIASKIISGAGIPWRPDLFCSPIDVKDTQGTLLVLPAQFHPIRQQDGRWEIFGNFPPQDKELLEGSMTRFKSYTPPSANFSMVLETDRIFETTNHNILGIINIGDPAKATLGQVKEFYRLAVDMALTAEAEVLTLPLFGINSAIPFDGVKRKTSNAEHLALAFHSAFDGLDLPKLNALEDVYFFHDPSTTPNGYQDFEAFKNKLIEVTGWDLP